MANLNDFTKKNPIFTGNTGIRIPSGTSADRDETANNAATFRYNQDIGGVEFYGPTGWVPLAAPPSISTVTPDTFNGESGTEFTINGANFTADAQVYFVTANSTDLLATTVTYIGSGQLLATTPRDILVSEEPLDIRVVQSSGSTTKLDAIDAGGVPTWVTTAGTLGSIFGANTVNVYVSATDPEESAVTYTINSGSLPNGLALTTANGLIQGLANSVLANTTFNFTIRASDTVNNNTDRTFSYTILNRAPVINTAAGSLGTFYSGNAVPETTIDAYDPDDGQVQFNISSGSLPDNTELGLSTGTISGTSIVVNANTTYTFEVTANDEGSLTASNTYSFTVLNRFPVWNTAAGSIADIADDEIDSYTPITVNAYDPDGEVVTYQLTQGSVPAGLTFVSANAAIAGVPESVESNTTSTFTVTASDGSNETSREFTMTVRMPFDPNFKETVLLLNGNGTNGAQNNTFVDSSPNNFTLTRNGNSTQGTFSPFSKPDGKWSVSHNAGWFNIPNTNNCFAFGSSDFCMEMFIYIQSTATQAFIIDQRVSNNTNVNLMWFLTGLNHGDGTNIISNTGGFNIATNYSNQWVHIAITRNGSNWTYWANGVAVGTGTFSGTINTGKFAMLSRWDGNYSNWQAYVSNLRVTIGSPVYTSAFTPPTEPLEVISGTTLLAFRNNNFKDIGPNNVPITVNGSPSVSSFSPFPRTTAYSPSVYGGSLYLDGTGDYLGLSTQDALPLGTENFTIEFWLYKNTAWSSGNQFILNDSASGGLQIWVNTGGGILRLGRSGIAEVLDYAYSNLKILEWTHFAYSRKGNNFALWVNGTRVATTTNTNGFASSHGTQTIGADASGTGLVNGFLSNIRVVQGNYIYDTDSTTITVPTAPLTAVSGTSLLCNFINTGILDITGSNVLETVGNAQIDTAVKKYGTGSMKFDGSGDYLFIREPDRSLRIGTGNVTIEAWVYWTGSGREVVMRMAGGSSGFKITSNYLSWGSLYWSPTIYPTNQWLHVCIQRQGSTCKYFLNGSVLQDMGSGAAGLFLDIYATDSWSPGLIIGKEPSNTVEDWTGYIDEVRISRVIRYDMNGFTPPTKAFPNV